MSNINYHWLKFTNGYAYKTCEIPLNQQGLVLVRGLNLDDGGFVGAGKTSPFEVFSVLQTGKVGKQQRGERILADDIINLDVGTGFEARLRFDVDGKEYEIVQCRKHPKWGNAYRIVDVDSARNILPNANRKRPQPWVLQNVLGLDDNSFFNLLYLAQNFSNIMLNGTDGDRQQSLIQMFGLDAYDELLRRTKQKLSSLTVTARDIVALREELEDINAELTQFTETPDQVLVRLAAKRSTQTTLQEQHDIALDQQEELQKRLRDLEIRQRYIREVKAVWAGIDNPPVKDLRAVDSVLVNQELQRVQELEDEVLSLRNSIRLLDQRAIIEQKLLSLGSCDVESTQVDLDSTRQTIRRLTNEDLPKAERRLELSQDLQKLSRPRRRAATIKEELEAAKDTRRDLERTIKEIKAVLDDEVCPTCGRAYDGEHDAAEYRRRLTECQSKLKSSVAGVHDLMSELRNSEEYEATKKALSQVGEGANTTVIQKEIGRFVREEKRLVGLLEAENLRETLSKQLAQLPKESGKELKKRLAKKEEELQLKRDLSSALRSLADKLDQINSLPKGKTSAIKARLIETGRTIREATSEIVVLGNEIAQLERTHEKLVGLTGRKAKIEKGIEKTAKVQTEIQCLQGLEKVFGVRGLKRERFMAILADAMEQTIPYYTGLLWPRHNNEIALAEVGGDAIKFELHRGGLVLGSRQLSGGERSKAGLSVLFGMRDLKEKYTGFGTNVLILDEPFGNLDSYGASCLLNVLTDLKNRFGTIIVIGNRHDVITKDMWDQTWWAVRENNEARLYREGLPHRYNAAVVKYSREAM